MLKTSCAAKCHAFIYVILVLQGYGVLQNAMLPVQTSSTASMRTSLTQN